jgi:rubrerythrin
MAQSINALIDFAIQREKEAQKMYQTYSNVTDNPSLKKLLISMMDQEKAHERKLLKLKSGANLEQLFPGKQVEDIKIADYLVDVEFSPQMDYQDFLILVMKKEDKSVQLYHMLAEKTVNVDIKQIFLSLMEEEKKHKAWAQDRYDLEILTDN